MLNDEILKKTFRYPAKKAIKNIFLLSAQDFMGGFGMKTSYPSLSRLIIINNY